MGRLVVRIHFAQTRRNVFVLARTDATETHRALAVILPERTLLVEVGFVKSKIVFDQKTAESRIDFVVVEIVHRVDGATAIVNGAFELQTRETIINQTNI